MFESYEGAVGSFNSEFGTQSIPVWETVTQFTSEENRGYDKKAFKVHEKHGSQFSTLQRYINNYGQKSLDFELEVYQSGLIQAFGMEIAFKAQRCLKPKSMGTL